MSVDTTTPLTDLQQGFIDKLLRCHLKDPLEQQQAQLRFYGFQAGDRAVLQGFHVKGQFARRVTLPLKEMVDSEQYKGIYVRPDHLGEGVFSKFEPEFTKLAQGEGVSDKHAVSYRVLKFDIDPERERDTSSTDAQHRHAAEIALRLWTVIVSLSGKKRCCAFIDSGNGIQLHTRCDLPVTEQPLVERLTAVLAAIFNEPGYKLDQQNTNPSRMVPLAATWKRKGSNDKETGRVHRFTCFAGIGNGTDVDILNADDVRSLLAKLEPELPQEILAGIDAKLSKSKSTATTVGEAKRSPGKPSAFFDACNAIGMLDVMAALHLQTDPILCPRCEAPTSTGIVKAKDGCTDLFHCFHASCNALTCNNVQLVSRVLCGVDTLKGDKAATKRVIDWFREKFPGRVPAEKSKAELAEERREAKAVAAKAQAEKILATSAATPTEAADDVYAKQDIGNAQRFIAQHGNNVRYCTRFRCWLAWDGKVWVEDDKENRIIKQLAHQTVLSLQEDVLKATTAEEVLDAKTFARTSGSTPRIKGMLEQAQGLAGVNVEPAELDCNPWILNVQNGIVDLKTGALLPHRREDLCTKIANVDYPEEDCPTPKFDTFLRQVLPDEGTRDYLLKYDGYSLSGVIREHLFVINVGEGRNGKGTHQEIMLGVLGSYAGIVSPLLFVQGRPGQSVQNDKYRAKLFGKRMVFASETEAQVHLNTTEVNSITGGDILLAKRLYQDEFEFSPTHKLQLATNHNPTVIDTTEATWRRLVLIQWGYTVPEGGETEFLAQTIIKNEGPGVLRKVVQACLRWQADKLRKPQSIIDSTLAYRQDEDRLGRFISACLKVGPKEEIGADDLYCQYVTWAEGSKLKPMSDQKFWKAFGKRPGITKGKNAKDLSVYFGVSRKSPGNDSQPSEPLGPSSTQFDLTAEALEDNVADLSTEPENDPEAPEGLGQVPREIVNKGVQLISTLKQTLPSASDASGNPPMVSGLPVQTCLMTNGDKRHLCIQVQLDDGSECFDVRSFASPNFGDVCAIYGVTELPESGEYWLEISSPNRVLVDVADHPTLGRRVQSVQPEYRAA